MGRPVWRCLLRHFHPKSLDVRYELLYVSKEDTGRVRSLENLDICGVLWHDDYYNSFAIHCLGSNSFKAYFTVNPINHMPLIYVTRYTSILVVGLDNNQKASRFRRVKNYQLQGSNNTFFRIFLHGDS